MKKSIVFLLFFAIILTDCGIKEYLKPELPDINVVDISDESNWDYWVVGKKDYYYINTFRSIPEAVLFHSSEANKDYSIFFTNNGLLDKVVVDGYIFVFNNFNGSQVDIGVINPDGKIIVLRDVDTGYDWDSLTLKSISDVAGWSDVIRWTGRVVAGVPCAFSAVAAISSGGIATPIALWTCGNYILSLSADIAENELDIQNGFTDFVDTYSMTSTGVSCSNPADYLSCVSGVASGAFSTWADHQEELENRNDDVQTTEAALNYGYGDVQITLTWDNEADLDLHVIDPYEEEIFWDHKHSVSNGTLDIDDRDGYGPENIYWLQGEAPDGNYEVYVHHYKWNDEPSRPLLSNYTVLVNAFGEIEKFTGSISLDETIHITDFNHNGIKSAGIKGSISITKSKKQF